MSARGAGVAWLATLVGQPREGREGGKRLDDSVTIAIAFHADPSADLELERLVAPGQPLELRKQAVFWMGQARGERGYQGLKHEGLPLLMSLARTHQSYEVRKQAMFWLGQSGDPRALAFFEDVLRP